MEKVAFSLPPCAVIAGHEPRHKGNSLEVPAARSCGRPFARIARATHSAQDRDPSIRNCGLIVGLNWHMIGALNPRGIPT